MSFKDFNFEVKLRLKIETIDIKTGTTFYEDTITINPEDDLEVKNAIRDLITLFNYCRLERSCDDGR